MNLTRTITPCRRRTHPATSAKASRDGETESAGAAHWLVLLACLFFPAEGLRAQESRVSDTNFNAWYMYFGDHQLGSGPVGIHFDGQYRRQGVGQKWQQLLLRPGVNYDLTSNAQASAGYAFIESHPYGDFPSRFVIPEHRLWQQLILKQKVKRAGVAHRFRLEQRFIGSKSLDEAGNEELTGYTYRNRFRYFVKGVIPILRDGGESDYFLALYNEVMFNFGRNAQSNIFDQNRAYIALGRKLPWIGNLEVGYLQQTVQQGNGRVFEFNHTLQVGLFSTLPIGRN